MRRVEWQVAEERPLLIVRDKPQSVIGKVVDDETLAPNEPAVVLQHGVEVVPPVAGAESVVFVEPAGVRVIRVSHAVVPLAERAGGVPGGLEGVAEGFLVEVQTLAAGGGAVDAATRMVATSEKLGTRRRADRADVEAIERGPVAGEGVDVGGLEVRIAVHAEVAPTLIVRQNNHDVRALVCGATEHGPETDERQESGAPSVAASRVAVAGDSTLSQRSGCSPQRIC